MDSPKRPARKPLGPNDLGPLHALLMRGLPDYIDPNNILDVRKLAKAVGISYQALYKWFESGHVSAKRLNTIIYLSEHSVKIPLPNAGEQPWKPLTREDFWDFLSR